MNLDLRVPAWCPMCEMLMKGPHVEKSFYSWGICTSCEIEFVEGRELRWKSGWRPSKEQIEEYVKRLHYSNQD